MKHISSSSNATIKRVEQLQRKSKTRKKEGLFVIEGTREIQLCDRGSFVITQLIVCGDIFCKSDSFTKELIYELLDLSQTPEVISISRDTYEKISYRSGTEGVIALAKARQHTFDNVSLPNNPLLLVAQSIEKPGNLGALLRTADAAGVDAVLLADPVVDLYNPNVIRSSVGCVFTVPVIAASTASTLAFLKENEINLYAATLQNSNPYDVIDYREPAAIAVGTEATGLTQEIRNAADKNIIIPMNGIIDSMNVSVSAAILIFEAIRQRRLS